MAQVFCFLPGVSLLFNLKSVLSWYLNFLPFVGDLLVARLLRRVASLSESANEKSISDSIYMTRLSWGWFCFLSRLSSLWWRDRGYPPIRIARDLGWRIQLWLDVLGSTTSRTFLFLLRFSSQWMRRRTCYLILTPRSPVPWGSWFTCWRTSGASESTWFLTDSISLSVAPFLMN